MTGHRLSIMRNQNSPRLRSDAEHVRIGRADYATLMSAQEIDRRLSPAKANDDLVVEIGVRPEARPHVLGV
jgi:hypothetical protein